MKLLNSAPPFTPLEDRRDHFIIRITVVNGNKDMVTIKAMVIVITLTICLTANTSDGYRYCCRRYMIGRLRDFEIKGYSVQTIKEMCPIDAIIFHTKKGKACTNPALKWVMDAVDRLRTKAQKVHQNNSQ
ncbi:C-C motif chemokine 20-like [Oreochromis aureus]|nr:C-C motif chemokine 20-like [Oreochromis aureus]